MPTALDVAKELKAELTSEKRREERMGRIQDLEDRVFETAVQVIEAALSFHEVHPQQTTPPPDWVDIYGEKGAAQRLEVAKAGWLPQSLAPNALKLAAFVQSGISRARSHKAMFAARTLNVKIALPAPTSASHPEPQLAYPEKEIE